jgi:hypothetical protein
VAVAVDEPSVVVLDDHLQVVGGGLAEQVSFSLRLSAFARHCERAKRTGQTVEVAEFVDGRVVQLTIAPQADRLVVSWRTVCILDVLTLEGLRRSLDEIIETLAGADEELRRKDARRSLRVLEGGR